MGGGVTDRTLFDIYLRPWREYVVAAYYINSDMHALYHRPCSRILVVKIQRCFIGKHSLKWIGKDFRFYCIDVELARQRTIFAALCPTV